MSDEKKQYRNPSVRFGLEDFKTRQSFGLILSDYGSAWWSR